MKRSNESLLNKKFGKLSVIENAPSYKYLNPNTHKQSSKKMYKCKCDCGNELVIAGTRLRLGQNTQCKECAYRNRPQSLRKRTFIERLFDITIKNSAKHRKLDVSLTKDEFIKIIKNNCEYCNTEPICVKYIPGTKYSPMEIFPTNGIDRINSNIGYHKYNCVACCKICNVMKASLTQEEFKNHIKKIHNYYVCNMDDEE